jgi:hypothetical protein
MQRKTNLISSSYLCDLCVLARARNFFILHDLRDLHGKNMAFYETIKLHCAKVSFPNHALVRLSKRKWNREWAGVPRTQPLGITRPGDQGVEEPSRPPESHGAKFLS